MSTKDYADAFKAMIKMGESLENLNQANHIALELKQITFEQFQAAAQVLVKEFLKR